MDIHASRSSQTVDPAQPTTSPLGYWNAPLGTTGARAGFAAISALTITLVATKCFGPIFADVADVSKYLQIASGDPTVPQPFAARQLGPQVARGLAALLHCSIQRAFIAEGLLSFLFTVGVVCYLMARHRAPRWLLLLMVPLPFWGGTLAGLALPDLWYAAMLSLFLLLLAKERFLLAACMMFPLMVSRESTSLTMVCLLLAGWKRFRWTERVLTVAAMLAGMGVVHVLTRQSGGNVEHLPTFLYMFAKVPWNLLRVVGLRPWSNLYDMCPVPQWQHSLHIGSLRAIGYCGFSLEKPLQALLAAATTFALLPLLTALTWWRARRQANDNVLLRFSLLYGAVGFVLAPLLGIWYERLFGYAWPLFLVALPMLLQRQAAASEGTGPSASAFAAPRAATAFGLYCLLCVVIHARSFLWIASSVPAIYLAIVVLLWPWLRPGNRQAAPLAVKPPQAA